MQQISTIVIVCSASTPPASSRAKSPAICRSNCRPSSNWSPTSAPRRRSAWKFPRRCSRAPTPLSNQLTTLNHKRFKGFKMFSDGHLEQHIERSTMSDIFEHCSSGDHICRIPSLLEPLVDRCEHFPRGGSIPLVAPQLGQAGRPPHFPNLSPLFPGF